MVSVLNFGASGLGSGPGRGHCVVFLGKTFYSHSASLSTQVYKWVLANLMLGGNPAMDRHSIQGGVEKLLAMEAMETRISFSLMGLLARMQRFFFFFK